MAVARVRDIYAVKLVALEWFIIHERERKNV